MAKQIVHKKTKNAQQRLTNCRAYFKREREKEINKSKIADRWKDLLGIQKLLPVRIYSSRRQHKTLLVAILLSLLFFIVVFLFRKQVLDVGFNLMNVLPDDAFSPAAMLTLLALDGNPLATLPRKAFAHLNGTLRGLSLGGRFLECDCRLRWVAEWIRDTDLQVTSRERSPQFCGSPPDFRTRSFYQLGPDGKNPRFLSDPLSSRFDRLFFLQN